MAHHETEYIPAAGHDLFLPLYDPIVRLVTRERVFRARFLEQADIHSGHRVLDIGCGTGTMAILIARQRAKVTIVGVDGDPKALGLARQKALKASLEIQFDEALADRLPYADGSFDRVLSSLMLHHLTRDDKLAALRQVCRVLAPGGMFHLADFGPPVGTWATVASRLFVRGERLQDNLSGGLPGLMQEAGLRDVQDRGHHNMLLGTIALFSAARE